MGKTAVFNQIVLYLETPKRDNLTPPQTIQALPPFCQHKWGPWDLLRRCKTHDASPRPSQHACNLRQGLGEFEIVYMYSISKSYSFLCFKSLILELFS